ncbi:MAG: hypothetical protein KAQ62_08160, partial [Cyclobacteriaceae bacterium]|nr:hypothetical protein [Cyclobacteriaceae bacterium]
MQRRINRILFIILFLRPFFGTGQVLFEQKQDIRIFDGEQNLELPWIGGLNSGQYNKADLDGDDQEELIIYDRSADIYQIFKIVDS